MYVCMCIYICRYIYIYMCVCVCLRVCVCVCVLVHLYTCLHGFKNRYACGNDGMWTYVVCNNRCVLIPTYPYLYLF